MTESGASSGGSDKMGGSDTMGRIVVSADPDIEDLIPGYLQGRKQDIATIHEALKNGDYETVRRIGHQMKGSGGGYGFDAITDVGQAVELAARAEDHDAIIARMDELADYLGRVDVVYE
jgi:HPt (histidine-containing phosphotransfer) domain-containing protein